MQNNSPSGVHGIDNQTKKEIVASLRNIYSDLTNDSIFTCSEHHKGCPILHGNVETPANQSLYVGNEVFEYDGRNYGKLKKEGTSRLQTLNGEEAIPVGMTRNNVKPAVGTFAPEAGQTRNVHANSCSRHQQVISVGCCCEGGMMEEDYLACCTGRHYQCEGLSINVSNAACCLHNVCKQTHEEIESTSEERKPINEQISDLILKLSSIEEKINVTNVNVGNIGHAIDYFSKLLNELSKVMYSFKKEDSNLVNIIEKLKGLKCVFKNGKCFQEVYSEEQTSRSALLNEDIDSITKTVKTNGIFSYQSHTQNAEITSEAQIQKSGEGIKPSEIAHHFDSPTENTREAAQPDDTVHHFVSHNWSIRDAVKPAKIRHKFNANTGKIGELAKPDLHQFGGRTENKVEKTYENNNHFDEQIENSFKFDAQLNADIQTESDRNLISIEESTHQTESNVFNEISEEDKAGAPTEMIHQIVEETKYSKLGSKIITDDLDKILEERARHSFENEENAFRSYKTAEGKSQDFEDAISRKSSADSGIQTDDLEDIVQDAQLKRVRQSFQNNLEAIRSNKLVNSKSLTHVDAMYGQSGTDSGMQTDELLEIIDGTQAKRVSLSSDNNLKAFGSNRLAENKSQTDVDTMDRQSWSAGGTQTDDLAEIIEDAQVKEVRLSFENNVEAISSNRLAESKSQTHIDAMKKHSLDNGMQTDELAEIIEDAQAKGVRLSFENKGTAFRSNKPVERKSQTHLDETGRESVAERKFKFDIQSESCSCRDHNYQNLTDNSQVNGEGESCFKVKIKTINISGEASAFKEHINDNHKTSKEISSSRKKNVCANEEFLIPAKHEESKLAENVELVETIKSNGEKSASLASSNVNKKYTKIVDSTKKKMEKNLGLPKDTKMLSEQKSQIAKKNKGSNTSGGEHEFKQISYIINKNELPEKAKQLNERAEITSSKKPLSSLKKTKLTKDDGKNTLSKLTTVKNFAKNDSSEKGHKSANSSKSKKYIELNSIVVPGRKTILNNTTERKNQQQCLMNGQGHWDNKHLKSTSKLNYNDSCSQLLAKRGYQYPQDYCEVLNIKELSVPNHEYKLYKANCKCSSRKLERSSIPKKFHDKLEQSENSVIKCTIRRISA